MRKYIGFRRLILVVGWWVLVAISLNAQTATFTTSGSFTVPAGVTSITVQCWGAGGGGGGSTTNKNGGSGGGSGGYTTNTFIVSQGQYITFTVGVGGTGVVGGAGNPGTLTSFLSLTANGGTGGQPNKGTVGAGGSALGGSTNTSGNNGTIGGNSGGNGGSSPNGGTGGLGTTDANGGNGNNPGAGGGGGEANGGTNQAGGNGGVGQIVITWTCTYIVTNFNITSSSPTCPGGTSNITVSSTTLATGNYTIYYNLSLPNAATAQTATMNFTAGSGSFNTIALGTLGSTTITITSVGCANVLKTSNITVNAPPSPPTGSSSQTFCNNPTTVGDLAAVGTSIQWYAASSGGLALPSTTPLVNGTTYFATQTVNGCESTSRFGVTVTINSGPSAPTITRGGPTTFCTGGNVLLTSSSTTGNQWLLNGAVITGATAQNYSATVSGSYAVRFTNLSGCSATSASTIVTVNPLPAAFVVANQQIALGSSIFIGGTAITGNTYSWTSNPAGYSSIESNPQVNPTVTTTYTLVETITATGCTNTHSVTITVIADNLAISKSLTVSPSKPGDPVQYTINYSNLNSTPASNVVIIDYLPSQDFFTYTSSSPSGVFDNATRTITWTFPSVNMGSYSITINGFCGRNDNHFGYEPSSYYMVYGGMSGNILSNDASISSSTTTIPIKINSPVTRSVDQFCGVSFPPLTNGYIKSATPSFFYYISSVTNTGNITDRFNLSAANLGGGTGYINVVIQLMDLSGNTINQTPWLNPGQSFSFMIRISHVGGGVNPGNFNDFRVTGTSVVCNTTGSGDFHTVAYGGNPPSGCDLAITKTTPANPATVGTPFTYKILVNNLQPDVADNVLIFDYLPSSLTNISYNTPTSGVTLNYNVTTGTIIAYKKSLRNTDTPIEINITGTPTCSSVPGVTNNASVFTSTIDVSTANDNASLLTNVQSDIPAPAATSNSPICSGTTATLTATVTSGYGYRWYDAATGGNLLFTGNPYSPTLTVPTTVYVSAYRLSEPICESNRTPVSIVVYTTPLITAQPSNSVICGGSNTSFSVTASSTGTLSYKWQVNTGSGFVDIINGGVYNGATSSTLTLTGATYALNGYQYRCLIQSATCGYVTTSATVTLTINSPPAITGQPLSQTICIGAPVTFSVTVSPTVTPLPTYQWRKGGVNIAGATGSSYTIPAIVAGDAGNYDVVLTNTCGTQTSSIATLSLYPVFSPGSHNTTTLTECVGFNPDLLSFLIPPSGGSTPYTYSWRLNGTEVGTSDTYQPPQLNIAGVYIYNCIVTDACGIQQATATKTINIVPDPVVLIDVLTTTVCQNVPVTLSTTITDGTGTYNYVWDSGPTAAGGWTPIPGATSSSYSPPTAVAGTVYYRVTILPAFPSCNNSSSIAVVNVNTLPTTSLIFHQ